MSPSQLRVDLVQVKNLAAMEAGAVIVRTRGGLVRSFVVGDPHYADAVSDFSSLARPEAAFDMLASIRAPMMWSARLSAIWRVKATGPLSAVDRREWSPLMSMWLDIAGRFNQGAGITVAKQLSGEAAVIVTLATFLPQIPDGPARSIAALLTLFAGDVAYDYAPAVMESALHDGPLGELTARQSEVLRFAIAGLSAKEMAVAMGCEVDTVHKHLKAIRQRLGVSTTEDAVTVALQAGMLSFVNS